MKTFQTFSPDSKIWIYQSSRELTSEEHTILIVKLNQFCKEWAAHNHQLKADYDIVYDRFVVLVVDESNTTASGCSIDKSVHFLRETGALFEIDFFDKLQMPFMKDYEFRTSPYKELKQLFKAGEIDEDTLFFDMNIQKLSEFDGFVKPLKKHWLMEKLG